MGMGKLRSLRQDIPLAEQVVAGTVYSNITDMDGIEGAFAYQAVWTAPGAVNITLSVEVSCNGQDWAEIAETVVTVTAANDNQFWDLRTGADFARVKIVVNSGTPTMKVLLNGKTR